MLSEKIEVFISARKLDNLDTFTTTDSYLIVSLVHPNNKREQVLKTKVYYNDLNPNYAESIVLDFFFEGISIY